VEDSENHRRIPNLPHLQKELLRIPPQKVAEPRLLQVAVLGLPNAGKSTLVNQLVGWNVCTVSKKVHTTRKTARAVFMEDDTQIVFLDTPGCVDAIESKKFHLEASFTVDPESALMQSDLLVVLHDVSIKRTCGALSPKILRLLHLYPEKQSVLNKVDQVKEKRKLLPISQTLTCRRIAGVVTEVGRAASKVRQPQRKSLSLENLEADREREIQRAASAEEENRLMELALERRNSTEQQLQQVVRDQVGWPHFSRLFMISALQNDGTRDLRDYLVQVARPARWLYNSSVVTDQNPHDMAVAALKGLLLDSLPQEIPYKTDVTIQYWDINPAGALNVVMNVVCPTARTVPVLIGVGGRSVTALNRQLETELRNLFQCDVRARLVVSSPSDRRQHPSSK